MLLVDSFLKKKKGGDRDGDIGGFNPEAGFTGGG